MPIKIKENRIIFEENPKVLLVSLSEKRTANMEDAELDEYIALLASRLPAPGGGAASALCGAQGFALASMVVNFTVGKKKFEAHFDRLEEMLKICAYNAKRMLELIDLDEHNFVPLSKAYGIKAETEEEKKAKETIMNDALVIACLAPLEMMHKAYEGLLLLEELMGISSVMMVSDIGVAAENFRAVMDGAKLNVMINIKSLTQPELKASMEEYLKEKTSQAEESYKKIMAHVYEKL